jgi:hypothetical protein
VVGGRTVATSLIDAGLIQDLCLTTSALSGGQPNTPFYAGHRLPTLEVIVRKQGTGPASITFEHFAVDERLDWNHAPRVCLRLLLCAVVSAQDSPSFEVASIPSCISTDQRCESRCANCRCPGAFRLDVAQGLHRHCLRRETATDQRAGLARSGAIRSRGNDPGRTIAAANPTDDGGAARRSLSDDDAHRGEGVSVYILGLAKDGPKFQPSTAVAPAPETGEKPPLVNVTAAGGPNGVAIDMGGGSSFAYGNNRLEARR